MINILTSRGFCGVISLGYLPKSAVLFFLIFFAIFGAHNIEICIVGEVERSSGAEWKARLIAQRLLDIILAKQNIVRLCWINGCEWKVYSRQNSALIFRKDKHIQQSHELCP